MTKLAEEFHDYVSRIIDADGIYPHPMLVRTQDDRKIVTAMDLKPEQIGQMIRSFFNDGAVEVIFGMDRWTKPGQGTTLGDVLTCGHWHDGAWHVGIIEYQHEPRIVKPWNWENKFWNDEMLRMLRTTDFTPVMRITVKDKDGKEHVFGRPQT